MSFTAIEIIQQCRIDGNIVRIPPIILERNLYLEVAKKIELIGGKWVGRKIGGFVFEQDPTELMAAISVGEWLLNQIISSWGIAGSRSVNLVMLSLLL